MTVLWCIKTAADCLLQTAAKGEEMERLGYYNGKFGPLEEMTVPMNDRASWFGDGIYEAGPVRNHKIFALEEHLARMYRNAGEVDIEMPVNREEMGDILYEMVKKVENGDQFLYWQVTRGTGVRQHVYPGGKSNLWITVTPLKMPDGKTPIKLITEPDIRFHRCDIKTLNLLPAVMASEKAKQAGCGEAVLYRPGGRVTECAHSNVHIIKDGTLITAPLDELILPGISRAHLLRACKALGIPVREEPYYLEELRAADEILVTSSSKLCVHADVLDGQPCGMKDPETFEKIRKYMVDEFLRETEA